MPRARRQHIRTRLPPLPRIDGEPKRSLSSLNLRFEEKKIFDLIHAYWRLDAPLSQPDAFSRILHLAVTNPEADLPAEARPLSPS